MSKQEIMDEVASEVKACRKCGLWKKRRNAVPGEGNLDADVMFIGEAPGYWEDVKGKPFVGAAGEILDEMLLKVGLSRHQVYITNVLKCRPPENRDPSASEIKTCTPYLDRQIRTIKPKIIVTLGRHSTSYILSPSGTKVTGITKLHGKKYNVELSGFPVLVIPMYHPAAVLYNPKYRRDLQRDFQLLRCALRNRKSDC
ncbi:MAG: type-4 uracil-DNA glycosylase [Candidatus Bathyarchaeia archaeon]